MPSASFAANCPASIQLNLGYPVPQPSEFDLIAQYFKPLAGKAALGLIDDAACLTPRAGHDLVISKDMLIAGRHFFEDDPPMLIAQKALRVNISDLAAKGAKPLGFLLGLALPKMHISTTPSARNLYDEAWLSAFSSGFAADIARFDCPLLGGDTVSGVAQLALSITVFGDVPTGQMLTRSGGKAGDFLYVSGTIGDAALGLRLREAGLGTPPAQNSTTAVLAALPAPMRGYLEQRYLVPEPRLSGALNSSSAHPHGAWMRHYVSASMDISDGLLGDAKKLAAASGLSLRIDLPKVPLSYEAREALRREAAIFELILTGGDDYELLLAVPPEKAVDFEAAARKKQLPVTQIGLLTAPDQPALWANENGLPQTFSKLSYAHF